MRGGTNSTSASTINITDNITVNSNYLTAQEVNAVRTGNVVQVTIRNGTVKECRDGTVISGLPRALVHSTIPLVNVDGACYGSMGITTNDNKITMYTAAIGQIWMVFTYLAKGGGIKALLGKARALLQEVLSHAGRYQCDKSKGQDNQSRRHREIDNGRRSIGRIIGHRYTVAHGTSIPREEWYVQQLRDDVAQFRSKLGRAIYKDHGRRNGIAHNGQVSQRNDRQSADNFILTKGLVA